ncbi:MAG TPA: polysaccharide deacetylase family protein [Burkholderiales bacterium]|nr:polysaccharide deacetylase family protein [Burkholderiales bacterium]
MTERFEVQPWKPSPTIRASFALHAVAGLALAVHPPAWPWALGAVAANHAFLTALGLWPTSALLGPNMLRLPLEAARRGAIALTIDDGPDPVVTPALLDTLDRYGARASFFCIGVRAARHRDLVREIARRGHSVENHTQHHSPWFSLHGLRRLRVEIEAAQDILGTLAGRAPRFFRAPAGLRSPLLDPVINRLGLRQVAWTRRGFDTVTSDPARVLGRLTRRLVAGDILLLHDGGGRIASNGRAVALEVLPALLEHIARRGWRCLSLPVACP